VLATAVKAQAGIRHCDLGVNVVMSYLQFSRYWRLWGKNVDFLDNNFRFIFGAKIAVL
jgi:hypothetical protein